MAKFKKGDCVRIKDYGSLMWLSKKHEQPEVTEKFPVISESEEVKWIDIIPELVGKIGYIDSVINTKHSPQYSINGIPAKHAWYDEEQLESAFENHHSIKRTTFNNS